MELEEMMKLLNEKPEVKKKVMEKFFEAFSELKKEHDEWGFITAETMARVWTVPVEEIHRIIEENPVLKNYIRDIKEA